MTRAVHICFSGPSYRYAGFYFEVHAYCGPVLLNAKGDPTNRNPPRAFWRAWEAFEKLTTEERKAYAVK